ncbi:hypothetical protein Dda_0582 [Drechslerella dactyloides]|uniref:Uncharacterized protein n=1 Tax=Drechslerella dactyloides TaxID=74499 RepID=A0AAD6J805_DREDA|nr:hypothetical protein Dda_0582 [Drechslerella dactyloides]
MPKAKTLIHPGYKAHPDGNAIPTSPARENTPSRPEEAWYSCSWLVPDTILRRRHRDAAQWAHVHVHNGLADAKDVEGEKEEAVSDQPVEPSQDADTEEAQGNVDSGHCADAADWDERGQCMCTITWQMPGRFPLAACRSVQDVFDDSLRHNRAAAAAADSASTSDTDPQAYDPANQQPAAPVRWERAYNPQTERHEYVAMHDARPHDGGSNSSSNSAGDNGSDNENTPRDAAAPFTCTSKPSWVRHVRRFVRAEELSTPPPPASQFIARTNKTVNATIKGRFSPGFFLVPYYNVQRGCFEYTDPQTDLADLKLKFASKAPPPKRVPPVPHRPKPPPRRSLVMPKGRWGEERPKPVVYPTYHEPVSVSHPPEGVDIEAEWPAPSYRPVRVKQVVEVQKPVFRRPRSVVFPQWRTPEVDETPCPPPRKRAGRAVARTRRVVQDDDGKYLPSEDSEPETPEKAVVEKPHRSPPAPKKKKKRRRRRNSDPTYKQHGVRENNKIEKEDLKKMCEEGGGDDSETDEPQKPPGPQKGKQKVVETKPNPKLELLPKVKKQMAKDMSWNPSRNVEPPARRNRRRNGDVDGAYISRRDPEEEQREQKDLRDMNREVDEKLEHAEGSQGETAEPEQSTIPESKPKPVRRRAPPADRAYRPGKRLRT